MKNLKTILLIAILGGFYISAFSQPVPPRCPGHVSCNNGGGGVDPIITHWPMKGNIPNQSIVFKWEPVEGAKKYFFTLFDRRRNKLFVDTTSNLGVVLDLPNLSLTAGEDYFITVNADNDRKSNLHRFRLKNVSDFQNDMIALDSDREYRSLNGIDKVLRKSDFLHEKDWNYAAVKALNFHTENLAEAMKLANHFETLRLKLDPPEGDE